MPVRADWNEWGFFDYSVVDARIQSYHRDVREHVPAQPYDRVYSVSVLAHMTRPSATRRWISPAMAQAGRATAPRDRSLAEERLPLEPLQGVEVEPPTNTHLDDLITSIHSAGLRVTERKIRRTVFASRTDLLFLEAVRRS